MVFEGGPDEACRWSVRGGAHSVYLMEGMLIVGLGELTGEEALAVAADDGGQRGNSSFQHTQLHAGVASHTQEALDHGVVLCFQ